MRFSLSNEQWEHLCGCAEVVSDFPATIGSFLKYFSERKNLGNFNIVYDHASKKYGIWYGDQLERFDSEELIDAMFDMFCHLEGV